MDRPGRQGAQGLCRVLAAALVLLFGCGEEGSSPDAAPEARWTVMVYMAGDSDISGAAFSDINEMEQVGSTADVNVVVQVEFSNQLTPLYPWDTLRGRVTRDDDPYSIGSDLTRMANLDMTAPGTLSGFIQWAAGTYPAERYALVLWSHGLGWKGQDKGMFVDETTAGTGSMMSLSAMAGALRQGGVVFDVIDFDSCLMGMYEVAYEVRDAAEYITFSEAPFPVFGDPYGTILGPLAQDPDMGALELARLIPAACDDRFGVMGIPFTKSAIRSASMDEVHACVEDLADSLVRAMGAEAEAIRAAVSDTVQYHSFLYRDLGDFLDRIREATTNEGILACADALEEALEDLVVENRFCGSNGYEAYERSHGLSIYLPAPGLNVNQGFDTYEALSCNRGGATTWSDFLAVMLPL
ncbi:MAG TPA: clostripain-related cysteine peptidase [Deltaproteobacteria bacterium]|nr:clostripain-related cysteine peptidase [Deltaproteobacteria bacterium]